jgi:prephenate dehydrogenase
MIERLCLIGVGLIGGSLALALRQKGLVREVVGVDPHRANLETARQLGIIDRFYADPVDAVKGADWVVMATPVGAIPAIFSSLKPGWRNDVVYTDTGSTKADVVDAARWVFGEVPGNFVPGHPIAGAESSGASAANGALFEHKRVILSPLAETRPDMVEQVEMLWRSVGGRVSRMDYRHHDEVFAATSHLPHVLAFVLTEMLGRKDEQQEIFQYAAGGFRDFTRIASSDPRMWLDICLANRQEIVPLIEEYREALGQTAEIIARGDADKLLALFTEARAARQRFLDQLEK